MEDVFVRRDLIDRETLRALCKKSDMAGSLQAGSHLGAILITGTGLALTWGTIWSVPIFLLHGVLINFLYAGQHELSHGTVFKTPKYNIWLGRAFGFVLLYARTFDQIQHFAHHRHTQDWARDGELERPPYTLLTYLLWLSGLTYWTSRITRLIRFTRGRVIEGYIPENRHAEVIREGRLHVAGYAALALASFALESWAAVTFWLAPMMLTKTVHQLQNTIEHLGLPHNGDILQNTRSTQTNALMRWLCWNMQYHTAHHAFPGVPFDKLPELDQKLFAERGIEPPRLGYLRIQYEAIKALARVASEADCPDQRVWIPEDAEMAVRPVRG